MSSLSKIRTRDPQDIIPPHFPSPSDNTPTHAASGSLATQFTRSMFPTLMKTPRNGGGGDDDDDNNARYASPFSTIRYPSFTERKETANADMAKYGPLVHQQMETFLQCDEKFCPDQDDLYHQLIEAVWRDQHSESLNQWAECDAMTENLDDCKPIFDYGMKIVEPILAQSLEYQRHARPEPLQDYDSSIYQSPFWFEGAGDIWRRIDHGSTRVSLADCKKLRQEAEQCLLDRTEDGSTDFCYRQFQHSMICEPVHYKSDGNINTISADDPALKSTKWKQCPPDPSFNCPHLRFPFLQCFRQVQGINYKAFRSCVRLVPDYTACKFEPTPQFSLHNRGKFFPDLSEFENPSGEPEFTQFDENGERLPPRGFYVPGV